VQRPKFVYCRYFKVVVLSLVLQKLMTQVSQAVTRVIQPPPQTELPILPPKINRNGAEENPCSLLERRNTDSARLLSPKLSCLNLTPKFRASLYAFIENDLNSQFQALL
ncbi:hypothetical protein DRP04_13575, partial [Archaeoglobales archaeon]